jgi:phage FluMu protein Com
MPELQVVLDFACSVCDEPMSVTVRCEGKGLAVGARTVASVKVPCPSCGNINQLYFEPNGTVRGVCSCTGPRPLPQPSVN